MCHRARFFVLVIFLKKIKTIISVVSPFNQFFWLSTPYLFLLCLRNLRNKLKPISNRSLFKLIISVQTNKIDMISCLSMCVNYRQKFGVILEQFSFTPKFLG